eukprot:m.166851 g.166851  ORF g.166851 m.166851 type:complete len:103 (-) comp31443_c0_seq1:69-377(-)
MAFKSIEPKKFPVKEGEINRVSSGHCKKLSPMRPRSKTTQSISACLKIAAIPSPDGPAPTTITVVFFDAIASTLQFARKNNANNNDCNVTKQASQQDQKNPP